MSVDSALTRTSAITINPNRFIAQKTHNMSCRCSDHATVRCKSTESASYVDIEGWNELSGDGHRVVRAVNAVGGD
jgi:hypothetical protein